MPVGERDFQFGDGGQVIAVHVGLLEPGERAAMPAVAQSQAQHDRPGGGQDRAGDVVLAVAQPPLVAGPAGAEHVVADRPAAEVRLEDALGADQPAGRGDGTVVGSQVELGTEQGRLVIMLGGDHRGRPGVSHGVLPGRGGVGGTAKCGARTRRTESGALGVDGQPLTEPAAMPSTILRLKKMNMMRGGMTTRRMVAKRRLYWVRNWLWKLSRVTWMVAFWVPGRK